MKRPLPCAVILVLLTCWSCSHLAPAGFWTRYRKDLIVFKNSDQGPWGGSRVIHWVSPNSSTFSEESARAYAEKNGWKYVERIYITSEDLAKWVSYKDKKPYFVLFGRDDERQCLEFPRHIKSDSIILKFESGWLREDPGTNEMSPAYGYVQINDAGTYMAVYHFWGNG